MQYDLLTLASASDCRFIVKGLELSTVRSVIAACPVPACGRTSRGFLSCGRPELSAAIPRRFSSSSLPPSFATGRRTTGFLPQGIARSGAAGLVLGGAS